MTPGTVTMNVTEDGVFEVHALTDGSAEGLMDGSMQGEVAWLAHIAGFGFGVLFALLVRRAIARRLRKRSGY